MTRFLPAPASVSRRPPVVAADDDAPVDLADRLGGVDGRRLNGALLEASISRTSQSPAGSRQDLGRASRPVDQHACLPRLRCADGKTAKSKRVDRFGPGEPREQLVYRDMHHPDHVETDPPPGFAFQAWASQP